MPSVSTLVAPAVMHMADDLLVWHGGLLSSGTLLTLTIVIEQDFGPPIGAVTREFAGINRLVTVAVSPSDGTESVHLDFGMSSGSTPVLLTRLSDQPLSPGRYVLRIEIPEIIASYTAEFTVR